jgi:LmbE family N-acetylglucosaminyl deacetylase
MIPSSNSLSPWCNVSDTPLRLLIIGAHPDDAEFHAGGLITRYREAGHQVRIVSVTNGAAGHHDRRADELIAIRREEADAVRQLVDVEYDIWEYPDGCLEPSLQLRERIIREVRSYHPDLVLTHRPCDYHPDHRYVGQAVQDATYMFTVPLMVPDVPALRRDPLIAYMVDFFNRPYPFVGDVVFDVTRQTPTIIQMLDCHPSQVYEWLPYNMGILDQVPDDAEARRELLAKWFGTRLQSIAERFRAELIATYGTERGNQIQAAEAYEISEYAAKLDAETRQRLFWFVPA